MLDVLDVLDDIDVIDVLPSPAVAVDRRDEQSGKVGPDLVQVLTAPGYAIGTRLVRGAYLDWLALLADRVPAGHEVRGAGAPLPVGPAGASEAAHIP